MLKKQILFLVTLCAVQLSQGMESLDEQLIKAVIAGNIQAVDKLITDGANPNARNQSGVPILHIAVEEEEEDICKLLIQKGADLNAFNGFGETALFRAGSNLAPAGISQLLIDAGADLNKADGNGQTPVMICTAHWHQMLQQLLAAGADCNRVDKHHKRTALMYAAMYRHLPSCELLLQHGADVDLKDGDGWRAVDQAEDPWPTELDGVAELLSNPKKIHAVIMRKDNPNQKLKKLRRFGPNIASALMSREMGRK